MLNMIGFPATSKFVSTSAASSIVKKVNSIEVISASSSSADSGMRTIPPKSVKCDELQCRKPSGAPLGGGEMLKPCELHI